MRELLIEAKTENLYIVLDFINEDLGLYSDKFKSQIAIVAEEIFVNIAHYAYQNQTGDVIVRARVGDELMLEFEDGGVPYNPLEKEDPDIELNADERNIGGLGIFMVKNFMDSVEYRYENNKNILTLKKILIKGN